MQTCKLTENNYSHRMGTLYYGDNLDILQRYIKDESVDLVYLDPPFKSDQNYNAFFQEKDGSAAASQIQAFEDTWSWNQDAEAMYRKLTEQTGKVNEVMQAFMTFLGRNDMMAYLTMMSPRLVELRRVLKPTGSLYLHCDPTASHYLKLLCDAIMGKDNFRSEIIWKRTSAHSGAKRFGPVSDSILFYSRSDDYLWNEQFMPFSDHYLNEFYTHQDSNGRRWRRSDLTGAGTRKGESGMPWKGINVTAKGRHWAVPGDACERLGIKTGSVQEKLDALDKAGRIHWPQKETGVPMFKRYADEQPGVPLQSLWDDIPPLHNLSAERLGYPTQKPVALLERIIQASSNPGGLVLDPFCGCGTTIDAAEKNGRDWIGIDITQVAMTTIKKRLLDTYESTKTVRFLRGSDAPQGRAGSPLPAAERDEASASPDGAHGVARPTELIVRIIGEPVTPADAAKLAEDDKFAFQWWAVGLVGARGTDLKKGADHGIDGQILFRDDPKADKPEQIIIQVKGGKTGVKDVRDLRGVIDREKAAIGILISLQEPTGPMETEAASVGFYEHKTNQQKFPRLQLRTVKELMEGKGIERPTSAASSDETFKKAPKAKGKSQEQALPGI
jgi:site-specific DNA-methyltransferase (adenine-specific)